MGVGDPTLVHLIVNIASGLQLAVGQAVNIGVHLGDNLIVNIGVGVRHMQLVGVRHVGVRHDPHAIRPVMRATGGRGTYRAVIKMPKRFDRSRPERSSRPAPGSSTAAGLPPSEPAAPSVRAASPVGDVDPPGPAGSAGPDTRGRSGWGDGRGGPPGPGPAWSAVISRTCTGKPPGVVVNTLLRMNRRRSASPSTAACRAHAPSHSDQPPVRRPSFSTAASQRHAPTQGSNRGR